MASISRENEPRVSNAFSNEYDGSSSEFDETADDEDSEKDVPSWDTFKCFPPQSESGSMQSNRRCFEITVRIVKAIVYGLLFVVVLCSAIAAKAALLFATSQLYKSYEMYPCNLDSKLPGKFLAEHTQDGRIKWTWCLIFMFLVPECIGVLNTSWHYFKRKVRMPKKIPILTEFVTETLHTIGLVLLTLVILPQMNAVQGAITFCCLCSVPGLLNLVSRYNENWNLSSGKLALFKTLDALAMAAQISGMSLWPLIDRHAESSLRWIFPVALLLCSIRWWGNFVSPHGYTVGLTRFLSYVTKEDPGQHIVQGYISLWRMCIFVVGALVVSVSRGIDAKQFFSPSFSGTYTINLTPENRTASGHRVFLDHFDNDERSLNSLTPLFVFAVQAVCTMITYQSCKFAYRTRMHQFGFAFPTSLASIGTTCFIMAMCADICALRTIMKNNYIFFNEFLFGTWGEFYSYWWWLIWLTWPLSQIWITMHLWTTENERLALAERIFFIATYDSLMIDQCLALNVRTRNENVLDEDNDENEEKDAELPFQNGGLTSSSYIRSADISLDVAPECRIEDRGFNQGYSSNTAKVKKRKDRVTKIYACATMWHEEQNEMNKLVRSILRLDKDQCAMRVTQKHYKVQIEDYYELETHVFFDDAFCCMHGCVGFCNHDENETQVNHYVITLVETVERNVENLCMRSSPPTKYPTPYGGRLSWTLPGKTQLVVHLKDKNKIRHRKRWSQVMYMYYLLGYRLMGLPIDVDRKDTIAENTYILTLDGDIDFRPAAVKVLVDLMKKDRDLGAACGRIHPVGSGPIVWFQKFEYAIGHWLQKSTEHTIGSVLCSPGCFSLFRAKALMQHNVMAKYATKSTEARHYIQYDQGEDRWLCTLLLQVGSRVEYSAASDAYTHAPELFWEFYTQRRRWISSTVANIFDLLMTSKETRKVNKDISLLYIVYQWILMGSTILGPGTIFLMLVGAFVAAFHIDNWTSFWYNLIPIAVFVGVCFLCKEPAQLLVAEIISVIYGLIMVVVLVGIMLQIAEDGWLAPSSLLFFVVAIQLTVAGLLHPQEVACLLCGIIYYITVPSMYMLLIIFSVFNMHNVTWGTRDLKKLPNVKPQDEHSPSAIDNLTGFMTRKENRQDKKKDQKGSLEVSLGDLFKCSCCIHTGISYEEKRLCEIDESLQRINKRLDLFERLHTTNADNIGQSSSNVNNVYSRSYLPVGERIEEDIEDLQHITTNNDKNDPENRSCKNVNNDDDDESDVLTQMSATSSQEARSNFLISPYWLQDERLRRGEVDFLPNPEEEFWNYLIGKYLRPIETNEESQNKITRELITSRDAYLLKFFMINALFVLIVFLMQLNKSILHLQWPLSVKYNVTYFPYGVGKEKEVHLTKEYLKLEPIGCLFIAAFISILGIQFFAMLIHRFDTFSHVLANAKLVFRNKEDIAFEKHADEIAQALQRTAEDDIVFELRRSTMTAPSRRKTVHELSKSPRGPFRMFGNFEKLFRRKLHDPKASGLTRFSRMPRDAFDAFERRRSTILEERRTQRPSYIYDSTDNLRSANNRTFHSEPGQTNSTRFHYNNPAFRQDE